MISYVIFHDCLLNIDPSKGTLGHLENFLIDQIMILK